MGLPGPVGGVRGVDTLLARGADVNAAEPSHQQTALMWAVSRRLDHGDAVKIDEFWEASPDASQQRATG